MARLLSCLYLLGAFAVAQKQCTTDTKGVTGVDRNLTDWAYLWDWVGCSDADKSAVLGGLSEAQKIMNIQAVRTLTSASKSYWSDMAMIDFLGNGYTSLNQRAAIASKFEKARTFKNSWFSWNYVKVFCEQPGEAFGSCKIETEPSYIKVVNEYDQNGIALAFCRRYFQLGTLDGIWKSVSGSSNQYNLQAYENRGRAWITAIFRIKFVNGMTPQRFKLPSFGGGDNAYAESASQTRFVGKFLTTSISDVAKIYINPSSYAWYAMAQYIRYNIRPYPYKPQVPDSVEQVPRIQSSKRSDNVIEARDQANGLPNDPCPRVNGTATGLQGNAAALVLTYSWNVEGYIDQFASYDPRKLPIVVGLAPLNQYDRNENLTLLTSLVSKFSNSGKRAIISVTANTGAYGEKTQKGSGALSDWVAQIEEDIDAVYKALPGAGGIFFQTNGNLPCGANNMYANAFIGINQRLKQKRPGAYTVLLPWPGTSSSIQQCFEAAADTLVTWHGSWTDYQSSSYKPLSWRPKDPRKIWHFVYELKAADLASAVALAKNRDAGFYDFTDLDLGHPHSENASYYPKLFESIAGASAPVVYM